MRSLGRFSCFFLLAWFLTTAASARSEPVLGDGDQDADRDLADFAQLANCLSMAPPLDQTICGAFDFSPDTKISAMDFRLFACGFHGPGVPVSAVRADSQPSPTTTLQVTLTGATAGATLVQVTGGLQPVTVPTVGCDYVAPVQLRPNVVNHLFVTGLFGDDVASAPFPVTITHDEQAPSLFIDFPTADAEITAAATDIAGRVADTLSGFAGMRVKVSVNNQPPVPAVVDIGIGTNGTFFLPSAPLVPGANTINVSALDGLGNFVEKQIVVTRVEVPPGAALMQVFSGNAQSAPIHAALPQPIRVQVLSSKGLPLGGKLVNFHVVRSDGRLAISTVGLFPGAEMLQVFTDPQGIARAFWRLGSDAGRGNNRIEVTSESVVGTTFFCASASAGPAAQINVGGGNNQRAQAGEKAPEPLSIWVNDSCNPVAGIAVTFTVRQGGGKVNGLDAVTINTGPSGHADVSFTLGPANGNNVIDATFPGNPNPPAVFTIFGLVRDAKVPTSFSGLVLDNAGQPIQNATCALVVGGATLPFVRSDIDGQFRFDDLPLTGPADLHVSGASATHVGGAGGVDIPANSFPSLRYSTIIVPNAANALPTPVLLPRLDPANVRLYSTTQDTELTVAGMAGLKMIVKAGSMRIRSGGPYLPAPNGTPISLNQVHHDDVPMPLPDGAAPPFAWTLQPGGARFDPPVTIVYPNMSGLPAGAIANFLSFNHDTGKFEIIASGHVTADGASIVTDPGSGITVAGWGCNCPPYSVTGQCCKCLEPCQQCVAGACVPTGNGGPCGNGCCGDGQACCDGTCVAADLICCDEGNTCAPDETCCQGDCCVEGAECCENGCCLPDQECCLGNCINALNLCCDNGVECFPEFPLCCGQGCCVADGVCCDDECQIPGSTCCFAGMVCSPPTPQCCEERCCGETDECCNGTCAPAGSNCCEDGHNCPPPDTVCCDELCLSTDQQCCQDEGGGVCDAMTEYCCGGACCGLTQVCCEGDCHPAGTECCSDGHFCEPPTPFCCGPECCAENEKCCDGVACFPADAVCCPGRAPCDAERPICCGAEEECCAPNEECCDGRCQPAGGTCCPGRPGCPSEAPECCGAVSCCRPEEFCCDENCIDVTSTCCGEGNACSPDKECCDGDACCFPDEECCQGQCCAPGEFCCDGSCCEVGGECCIGRCLAPGNICCDNGIECFPEFPQCCGQNCCATEATCCEGECVPLGSSCCSGFICSPPTQECCGDTCCCHPGQTCCVDGPSCTCIPGGHICP